MVFVAFLLRDLSSGRDGRRFLNGTRPEEGESSYVECQDKLWYRRMHRGGPHFDTYSGAHYQDYDGSFVFQMRRHNRLTCDWGTAPEPEYFTLDFFRDIGEWPLARLIVFFLSLPAPVGNTTAPNARQTLTPMRATAASCVATARPTLASAIWTFVRTRFTARP